MNILPSNGDFQPLTSTAQIEACLTYLSRVCDGAAARDDHGFNGSDSKFGKDLAAKCQIQPLTHRQLLKACEMLQKYRKQLSSVDLLLPTVEELQTELAAAPKAKPVRRNKVVPIKPMPAAAENKWRDGLNEQQAEAFDLVHQWFFNKPDQPFVLTGYAGSGKSYSVQRIIHSLKEQYKQTFKDRLRVALVAPTHKAVKVLQDFADAAGLHLHIGTLHSLLHVMPGLPDENGKLKLTINKWSQEPHYCEFGLVVIDESSMIGEELLSFIPKSIPTIFMGDRAQLSPIETDQDGEPQDSPIFSLPCGINLTQVMRYEGCIADYAIALRTDINASFVPRASKFIKIGGNLSVVADKEAWESKLIQAFSDAQLDPSKVRALAWTNHRVSELNRLIRDRFFDPAEEFSVGERLMAKEPIILKNGSNGKEIVMQTCQECTIHAVYEAKSAIDLCGLTLELITYLIDVVTDQGKPLRLTSVSRNDWKLTKTFIGEAKKRILETADKNDKRSMWRDYYQVLETLNLVVKGNTMLHRLQPALALTAHQSQGSTFKHVFVDQSNIFGCRQPKSRNQLLYVSATRAAEHLTIYAKF